MNKHCKMALAVMALGSALSGAAWADGCMEMNPAEREKKLNKMSTELKLSQDQKNKVRAIKDEKYQKIEAAKKDAQNQIRGVLNADQQGQFDKMIADKSH